VARDAPVAVVTGASRGIGFGIAQRLVADGYAVAVIARRKPELIQAVETLRAAERVLAVAGPGDGPDHTSMTVDAVVERFGRLDLLVNEAGTNPVMGPMLDLDAGARKILEGIHYRDRQGMTATDGFSRVAELVSVAVEQSRESLDGRAVLV
jgi:NAD(P)-dependent dehydrogenase (short-subunit alcohol dehydrogenase family)